MLAERRTKERSYGSNSVPPKPTTVTKFTPAARAAARRAVAAPKTPVDDTLQIDDSSTLAQQKRVALQNHSLWVSCLKGWWEALSPLGILEDFEHEEGARGYLAKDQYLSLSVRLQKCVQKDFQYPQACAKAEADWELEFIEFPDDPNSPRKPGDDSTLLCEKRKEQFIFASFADFLFDTAEEFYPYVSPPAYLFVVNALMLQVSSGSFLRSSMFRDVRDIKFLPDSFFSVLHSQEEEPSSLSFPLWYQMHFSSVSTLMESVLRLLFSVFPSEVRIVDIWHEPVESTYSHMLLAAIKRMDAALMQVEPVNSSVIESVFEHTAIRLADAEVKVEKGKCLTERKPQVPVQTVKAVQTQDVIQLEETPMLDPRIYSNRIEFRRVIKLPLLGKSYAHKVPPPHDSHTPADSTISTVMQPVNSLIRTATRESDSQTHSQQELGKGEHSGREKRILLQKSPQRSSGNESERGSGNERQGSSPDNRVPSAGQFTVKYRTEDIKFAGLPKEWRRGRFQKPLPTDPLDMRGIINRKSQQELSMERELQADLTIRATLESAEKARLRHKSLPLQTHRSPLVSSAVTKRIPAETVQEPPALEATNALSSGKGSAANSVIEKEVVVLELGDEEIKVAGRSLSPAKVTGNQSDAQSPFPSRMSGASSPPPMSAVTYREEVEIPKAEKQKVTTVYDFRNFAHLLLPDHMPEKMEYDDPMEFLYALNILKYQYNKAHESEFLHVISGKNIYESRRDELGGSISQVDWKEFISRIERLARMRNRRRRLRRARRRRLGLPPKQRKPEPGELPKPNLKKNLLWKSVFLPKKQKKAENSESASSDGTQLPVHKAARMTRPRGIFTQKVK